MSQSKSRVVGSNYTVFRWNGRNIAFLEGVQDSGVQPIAAPQAITPLGANRPTEFVTARATRAGTLTFSIRELWEKPIWQHLFGLAEANDIVDVWEILAAQPRAITCQTIIKPPGASYRRVKTYHNCVVSSIEDGDNVTLDTLSVVKRVQALYTHATNKTVSV